MKNYITKILQTVSDIRDNPLHLLFEPGLLPLLVNAYYRIRKSLYRELEQHAPNFTGDVLDIGCGSKPYASLFRNAQKYIGMDIEVSGHNHNLSKIDIFYDGRNIPFNDKSFDNVVSFETFEHVFNLDELLEEVHRVLKVDGTLMFSIPFCWPEHEQPYDFGRYTSFGIVHKLNMKKFDVEYMRKSGDFISALTQLWVEYFRAQFFPKSRIGRLVIQLLLIFPMVLTSKILSIILPKRYEYYYGMLIKAKKIENDVGYIYKVPKNNMKSPLVIG